MVTLPDSVLMPGLRALNLAEGCAIIHNAFTDLVFSAIKKDSALVDATRSAVAGRRNGLVPYSAIERTALAAVYRHPQVVSLVAQITRQPDLQPLPEGHELACSLLVYEKAGDHIRYHYDRNYFKGKTFTVLYTVLNSDASQLLPSSNTTCLWKRGERCIATQPNSLLVLNGEEVLHSAKPLGELERRVVLSMVYSTDTSQSVLQSVRQRVKDWSFGF